MDQTTDKVKAAVSGNHPSEALHALLSESDSTTKTAVFKQVISMVDKPEIIENEKRASELIACLQQELNDLPEHTIIDLTDIVVEQIEQHSNNKGRSLQLLVKLLDQVSKMDIIAQQNTTISGEDHKNRVIKKILESDWHVPVTSIITMFKDITLNQDQLKGIIERISKNIQSSISEIHMQDLPQIIYQFLLLSTQGQKGAVLESIFVIINKYKKQVPETDQILAKQFLQIQGTILLHIDFSIKQDQSLGKEFIKLVKNHSVTLTQSDFNFAALLSMAKIHRFEDTVFTLVKSMVQNYFRYYGNQATTNPFWLKAVDHLKKKVSGSGSNVPEIVMQCVHRINDGWDSILNITTQLGFFLVDSALSVSKADAAGMETSIAKLGSSVITELFENHAIVRQEILDQLLSRIVAVGINQGTANTTHLSSNSFFFIKILASIAQRSPQFLAEHAQKVKEALDYLSVIPSTIAESLLDALLTKAVMASFQDHVMLVLKKSLFNREVSARLSAVGGFLKIMHRIKEMETESTSNNLDSTKLAIEILGLLKRCLGQQTAVKSKLYEGLSHLARQKCHPSTSHFLVQLHESILQLFQIPLIKYYEPDVTCFPLKIQESNNLEPLHHLLFFCAESAIHLTQESQSPLLKQIIEVLDAVAQRVCDMDIDRSVIDTNDQAAAGSSLMYQIVGIYEALIDYSVQSDTGAEQILKLFGKLSEFQKDSKSSTKPKSKKKKTDDNEHDSDDGNDNSKPQKKKGSGKTKKSKETEPLLSLKSCIALMALMCGSNDEQMLRSADFAQYVTQTCSRHLQQILKSTESLHTTGDMEDSKLEMNLQSCFRLGMLCFSEFTTNWTEPTQGSNENTFPVGALECLEIAVKIVAWAANQQQFVDFVKRITPENDDPAPLSDSQAIHACLDTFQYLFLQLVEHGSKTATESEVMISIITCLFSKAMSVLFDMQAFESQQSLVSKMTKWLHELFKQPILNPLLAKSIVGLFMDHGSDSKHSHQLVLEFVEEIRTCQLNLKTNQNHESKWKIINEKTINPIVSVLISRLDTKLNQCEWALANLKETHSLLEKPQLSLDDSSMTEELASSHSQIMSSVYAEMESILTIAFILAQLVVTGAVIDALIKLFTKLYNILNKTTKDVFDAKAVPSQKFVELVDYSGSKLSPQISTYLQSIEQNQKTSSDAKLQKESRAIPNLIFSIEKYEISLIKLCKQSKLPLMKNFHRSTARDFRLDLKAMQSKKEEQPVGNKKRGTTNGKTPKTKKQKVTVKQESES